jgi:hypothetical protein
LAGRLTDIDGDDPNNTTSSSASARRRISTLDVHAHIKQGRRLKNGTDNQGNAATDAVNDPHDVNHGGNDLHETKHAGREQCRRTLYANSREDLRGKVVEGIRAAKLVEEEEGAAEEPAAAVGLDQEGLLEDLDGVAVRGELQLGVDLGADLEVFLVQVGVLEGKAAQLAEILETLLSLALGDEGSGSVDDDCRD